MLSLIGRAIRRFGCEDLIKRDKLNLDIFWLKDASLDDPDNLPCHSACKFDPLNGGIGVQF